MYHDQGLPVLKHASFGQGVNVTLGLPIVRTSVDHGTALDLAGTGRADPGSLVAAIELAAELAAATRAARASRYAASPAQALQPELPDRRRRHRGHRRAVAPRPGDLMVEIGPGLGALTRPLGEHVRPLHVVEIDRDIVARLRGEFPPERVVDPRRRRARVRFRGARAGA